MSADATRRNVILLSLSQALLMIGTSTLIAEAALVGHMLATDKALATLPIGMMQLMSMLTTIPASLLMRRIGRRAGFSIGAGFGILGATVATYGVLKGSFVLFALGTGLGGIYSGFGVYYRFAAVDSASGPWKAKAISYVLAGGVIAAAVGPELSKHTKDLLAPVAFAGSFASLIGVAALALAILQFLTIPPLTAAERRDSGRPLGEIMRQPAFLVAVLGAMSGYAIMSFVMTATPLAMQACGYGYADAADVIKWHILAMFGPAFFTGQIINRFGAPNVMIAGALMLVVCAALNLSGIELWQFTSALILLGVGWNFLFTASTALLTTLYRPSERAKVQAANDFLVFGLVAAAAFSSGFVHHWVGWQAINAAVLPLLAVTLVAVAWLAWQRRGTAGVTSA